MSVIENFAALSSKEQIDFAAALLKTINSEHTFTSDTMFEIEGVEADELTGGLVITCSHPDYINVSRKATWTCDSEDSAGEGPGREADYENLIFEDAKNAFDTLSAEIDGYTVSLEVVDVDEDDTVEVEVDDISHEDAGIGGYDYWGASGYDSQPYVEVEGTAVKACGITIALIVEPTESFDVAPEEN